MDCSIASPVSRIKNHPNNSINIDVEGALPCASFIHNINENNSSDTDVDLDKGCSSLGNVDTSIHEFSKSDDFNSLIYHHPDSYQSCEAAEDTQSDRLLETVQESAKQVLFKPDEANEEITSTIPAVSEIVSTENNERCTDQKTEERYECDINESNHSIGFSEEQFQNGEKLAETSSVVGDHFKVEHEDTSTVKTDLNEIFQEEFEKNAGQPENSDCFSSQLVSISDIPFDPRISLAVDNSGHQLNGLSSAEKCQNEMLSKSHEKNMVVRQNSKENEFCISKAECMLSMTNHYSVEGKGTVQSEDQRPKKVPTSSWDPVPLLNHLYQVELLPAQQSSNEEHTGNLDILPLGTFVNQGGSYFIKLIETDFLFFENEHMKEAFLEVPLQYGKVEVFENNTMILDNMRGRSIHMKFQSCEEMKLWKATLELHCYTQKSSKCVEPIHFPLKCHKNIIIIDLGSCSTRAGILMDQPTLPHIFFPTVCATNKTTCEQMYGMEALLPEVRQSSVLSFPVRTSAKVTKFTMDIPALEGLFQKIFNDLNVDPKEYTIQVCLPRALCMNTQVALLKLLLEELGVKSVSLTRQALLTLYAYNSSTGIVVDIGDRMDILTVVDGFIIEKGVSRLPYGGQRVIHHMRHALAQKHISLSNEVESFVVQYIMENLCYIAEDYEKELQYLTTAPEGVKKSLPLFPFFQGDNILQNVTLDGGRFQTPEGLFDPDLWGVDFPGLHKLVHEAIQCVGVDARRCIAESIYVSGGVTLMPGLVERLEAEVSKLTLPRLKPQIHASPYRYHMAYLGACQLASSDGFPQVCVSAQEWSREGPACLRKWHL